jgi:hypothetical protein
MKYAFLYHRDVREGIYTTIKKMKKVFNANETADLNGWHKNTDLAVNLKTVLHSDTSMRTGKDYQGVLRRDWDAEIEDFRCRDAHYTFIETVRMTADRRNPHVFYGKYITITRRPDGTLRPNFKPMPAGMSVDNYAFEVYRELRGALKGLVEK